MKKKYTVQLQDDSIVIINSTQVPKSSDYKLVLVGAPAEARHGSEISLVDVTDPDTEEVTTEAQLDPVKVAAYDAALAADQAAKDAVQYKEDRRGAYPAIGDQLDALYKKLHLGDSTEYDALAADITQVKIDYPKPE